MFRVARPRRWLKRLALFAIPTVMVGLLVLSVPLAVAPTASLAHRAAAPIAPSFKFCSCSAGAVFIPTNPSPGGKLHVGDVVTVTVEFMVMRWNHNYTGVNVHIPIMGGNLPLSGSGFWPVTITPRNLTIAGPGWSNASLINVSKPVTSNVTLDPPKHGAYLSSERIAIMANVPHATFKLAFQWRWSVHYVRTGNTTVGNWSNLTQSNGTKSIIVPAPWVWLLPTTVKTLELGGTFVARLQGMVANQGTWLYEMEFPTTGDVIEAIHIPGPTGTTTFWNATFPMMSGSGATVPPGAMLVHIHDGYGDIVWSISVHLYTPKNTTVHFLISPGQCGPVTFNGTVFTNNTYGTFPTAANYSLVAGHCKGIFFYGWSDFGGGATFGSYRAGVNNATLYYNTTITAKYA